MYNSNNIIIYGSIISIRKKNYKEEIKMGLYSNTRLSSLNEYASEEFKQATKVESLIETCIGIRENDYKMFSTLLNLDFAEASLLTEAPNNPDAGHEDLSDDDIEEIRQNKRNNEDVKKEKEEEDYEKKYGNMAASQQDAEDNEVGPAEAKKKSIWKKIVDAIQTVINAIKGFFEKAITKIGEVIRRDKAITEKYKDAFTSEKIAGFGGIEDFNKPTMTPEAMQKAVEEKHSALIKDIEAGIDKVAKADSKDSISSTSEEVLKNLEEAGKDLDKKFFEKVEKFVPDTTFMATALQSIGERTTIVKAIKAEKDKLDADLSNEKKKLSDDYKKLKKGKDTAELQLAAAAASFKMAQGFSRGALKLTNDYIKNTVKAFGAYRKAVLIVGKYALGKKEEKKEANASYKFDLADFTISEASDLYVYESILA